MRRILQKYERDPLPINAVYPGGRRIATKVRVFVDFLAEIFEAEPSLALEQRGRRRKETEAPVAKQK